MTKKELEILVGQLEIRIANLEAANTITIPPLMDPAYENKCSICGVVFEGTMGYVCDNTACPMYPRSGTGGIIFDHTTTKG